MRFTTTVFSLAALALATGCSTTPEKVIEYVTVEVPVPVQVGCVAETGRPARPTPLRDKVTEEEWKARAPGAKIEGVKAQAGDRMNYEDLDAAATSACR